MNTVTKIYYTVTKYIEEVNKLVVHEVIDSIITYQMNSRDEIEYE